MLKIRAVQMSRFADVDARRFRHRLRELLQEQFEDAREMLLPELDAFIEGQLIRAPRYGLNTEKQQAVYVVTAFVLGRDFDERMDAARQVLPSPLYTADDKSEWLSQWTLAMVDALTPDA